MYNPLNSSYNSHSNCILFLLVLQQSLNNSQKSYWVIFFSMNKLGIYWGSETSQGFPYWLTFFSTVKAWDTEPGYTDHTGLFVIDLNPIPSVRTVWAAFLEMLY